MKNRALASCPCWEAGIFFNVRTAVERPRKMETLAVVIAATVVLIAVIKAG